MPAYNVAHQDENEDQDDFELVGSKDLRESFKEKGRLRGSFSINGHEFHQFESNSPANLVALLNAKQNYTHVFAEIDDGGHLVLTGNGPSEIRIAQGAPYEEVAPAGGGDVAEQVLAKLKQAADKDASKGDDGKPKNTILEDLGLETTKSDDSDGQQAAQPGFETGASADDRKKAREQAKQDRERGLNYGGGPAGNNPNTGTAGQTDTLPTDQSSPITGSGDGAKMADGRDRTGQGAGYSVKPDGTPAVAGTPAAEAAKRVASDPTANVPRRPLPQG